MSESICHSTMRSAQYTWILKLQDIRRNIMRHFKQNTSWYFAKREFLFLVSVLIWEPAPKPVHTSCISSSTSISCGKRAVVKVTGNTCCKARKIVNWDAHYYSRNTRKYTPSLHIETQNITFIYVNNIYWLGRPRPT